MHNCHDCHDTLPVYAANHAGASDHATLHDPPEARICYGCADTRERLSMRKGGKIFAYLSADQSRITTWTGGVLARVTWVSFPKRVGFGRRQYVNAIDATGQKWHGSGPVDSGNYVRLTRTKGSK